MTITPTDTIPTDTKEIPTVTQTLDTTVNITLDNVLLLLEQAMLTKGRDYDYHSEFQSCDYGFYRSFREPEYYPACIVGHVIHMVRPEALGAALNSTDALNVFGYDNEEVGLLTGDTDYDPNVYAFGLPNGIERVGDGLPGIEVDVDSARVMLAAQSMQDARYPAHTWGEAYDFAAKVHALLVERRDGAL